MNGSIHVGYNHDRYMLNKGVKSIHQMTQTIISQQSDSILSLHESEQCENDIKMTMTKKVRNLLQFRYPLQMEQGQIVGIYEIMFLKRSMYQYKA